MKLILLWLAMLAVSQSLEADHVLDQVVQSSKEGAPHLNQKATEEHKLVETFVAGFVEGSAEDEASKAKLEQEVKSLKSNSSANAIQAAQTAQKLDAAQTQLAATKQKLTAALKASAVEKQKHEEQLAKDAEQDAKMQQIQQAEHRAAVNASQVKFQKQIQELRDTHASANAIQAAQTAQKLDTAQTQLAAMQNNLTAALKASAVQKQKHEEQLAAKDAEQDAKMQQTQEAAHRAAVNASQGCCQCTKAPTKAPTKNPTTKNPTKAPTKAPTKNPTRNPTKNPTEDAEALRRENAAMQAAAMQAAAMQAAAAAARNYRGSGLSKAAWIERNARKQP